MTAFVVVPCLLEGRAQLDARFPQRDKSSEGTIGDAAHQKEASSHNPDETGTPEFSDHDGKNEVRAWDADKDLRDPHGVTAEELVQMVVTKARAGGFSWIRYIIYNKRIWHRKDNFTTRTYTGSNPHTDHVHFNSDFTQAADTVTGTNWHFNELGSSSPTVPTSSILNKGDEGPAVTNLQLFFNRTFPAYRYDVDVLRGHVIEVDGKFGPQTEAWVKEFQSRTHLRVDGIVGPKTTAELKKYGYKTA